MRKPGRPISTDPRLFDVTVALTEAERTAVEREAILRGIPVARVLRELVFGESHAPLSLSHAAGAVDRR